jgi:hypothetical protein
MTKKDPHKAASETHEGRKVWKYTLEDSETKEALTSGIVEIPSGAKFLSAQAQNGVMTMWFLIDNRNTLMRRKFVVVGTGRPLPEERVEYLATVKLMGDNLIGHLFEYDSRYVEQSDEYKKATNSANPC